MAPPHTDLWGFETAAPPPPCLQETRERSEAEWSAFSMRREAEVLECTGAVKELVRQCGICPSRRCELWLAWSGGSALKGERPARYSSLIIQAADAQNATKHQVQFDQVEVDLERTFPEHPYFQTGAPGLTILRRLLRAFILDAPEIGYTQSMNYIAAYMMLVTGLHEEATSGDVAAAEAAEEDAFWLTYSLCRRAIAGYHTPDLGGLRTDLHVFSTLVEVKHEAFSAHLTTLGFPKIDFVVSRWFLCCFFGVLPSETAVRVMDIFFAATHGGNELGRDGPSVLFRIGLGLLSWIEHKVMQVTADDSILACMEIQRAGADILSTAEIDILLFTSFETFGQLRSVQNMRARIGEQPAEAPQAPVSSPACPTPGSKRKRRGNARVWSQQEAAGTARAVAVRLAAEENVQKSSRPGFGASIPLPMHSPGRPKARNAPKESAAGAATLPSLSLTLPAGSDSPTAVFSSNGDFIGNVSPHSTAAEDHSASASRRNKQKWRSGNGALKLSAQSASGSTSTRGSAPAASASPAASPRRSPRLSGGGRGSSSPFAGMFSFGRSGNSTHSPAKGKRSPYKSPSRSPSSRRLSSTGSSTKKKQQRGSRSSARRHAAPVRCNSQPDGIEMSDLSGISAAKKMKILLQADEEEHHW